jgi:AAA family ATPase
MEYISPGLSLDFECKGQKRTFRIAQIQSNEVDSKNRLYRFSGSTKIRSQSNSTPVAIKPKTSLSVPLNSVGGLDTQISRLNRLFKVFTTSQKYSFAHLGGSGGILIHGSPGTGKTLLLDAIASTGWGAIFRLDQSVFGKYVGETEQTVRNIFKSAINSQPSIIIIDDLESIAPKKSGPDNDHKILSTLASQLDNLSRLSLQEKPQNVLVIASSSRPNDIDSSLRRPGRIESEIELPIPDVKARREILTILSRGLDISDSLLDNIASKTHGFVGADLQALLKQAVVNRIITIEDDSSNEQPDQQEDPADLDLTSADIDTALLLVRPTAMREIFLEPPKVYWHDIGGQAQVKQSLNEAISWPLKHPQLLFELGITPRKGVLLYGPPGCSKTLTAQALATEAGLNFIAVKGAELINMYVGESERSIREVFRKARAASPSIIFFDEIDAIAKSRDSDSGSGGSSGGGLNVLTTLLNEMDGIETLKGVVVLAATNKPELLDAALMRPGRLDTILYVGPPDLEARVAILKIKSRKMKIADDVQIEVLGGQTAGYSGAEVVNLCDRAGHEAMRETLLQIEGRAAVIDDEEQEYKIEGRRQETVVPIRMAHFENALAEIKPQISELVRRKYETWSVGGITKL